MRRQATRLTVTVLAGVAALLWSREGLAHTIQYHVEQQVGIAVRAYYSADDPVSYSEYELHGPGDEEPHQIGRTDRNGYLAFVPDRQGTWRLQVWGESTHGFHGVTTEIVVDEALALESFSRPLVATHTKLITGISVAFGLFGLWALWTSRRKTMAGQDSDRRAP
jgi:nickel transport protein